MYDTINYCNVFPLKMGKELNCEGESSPVVSVLDSGSDGPGSSPGWGMTLCP